MLENWANLLLSLNVQKRKVFKLYGGFTPDPLTRGSVLPLGPVWYFAPDPHYKFAFRARCGPRLSYGENQVSLCHLCFIGTES